jgi:hypothetical protein
MIIINHPEKKTRINVPAIERRRAHSLNDDDDNDTNFTKTTTKTTKSSRIELNQIVEQSRACNVRERVGVGVGGRGGGGGGSAKYCGGRFAPAFETPMSMRRDSTAMLRSERKQGGRRDA